MSLYKVTGIKTDGTSMKEDLTFSAYGAWEAAYKFAKTHPEAKDVVVWKWEAQYVVEPQIMLWSVK